MGHKMPFFSNLFPRDEFLLFFWNLYFAHAEVQGKLKKEDLIKSVFNIIRASVFFFSGNKCSGMQHI
jgi:hypothetical protein